MPLDFPNTPTLNQSFTAPNGVVWTWDGVKWANGTTSTGYAPLQSPVFTGDPQAPTPASGDHDTSIATTAFVAPAFNATGRNLLHNPLFNVAQRGAGPFTVSGNNTVDRWKIGLTSDTVSFTWATLADSDRSTIGDEAAENTLVNVFTGNAAAGAFNLAMQCIEDVRRLAGKTVTVSFWANSSVAGLKLGIALDQNFGTGGSPSASVNGNGQAVTIGTAFARYSITYAVPSVIGKTLGTNGDSNTQLDIWYSSGTTMATRAGNIGVQSGAVHLWGVQLEVGSIATPLEKPDPQQDLAKCQRFYQIGLVGFGGSANGAATNVFQTQPLAVQMRAAPTVNYINSAGTNITSQTVNSNGSNSSITPICNVTAAGFYYFQGSFIASADL